MPIDLGLSRITRLLSHLGNPQLSYKSIHIAGTNGKGSTIAYLSSIFTQAKVCSGRFTSPHLLQYNDCICINNKTYPFDKFEEVRHLVKSLNETLALGCTEFEVLTVTALKIFEIERVELALIEVGLGGRLDATNVLEPYDFDHKNRGGVVVTGITKVGIDHESFLGNTLGKIASEKAGIIKKLIPTVVDNTNEVEALEVINAKANTEKSKVYLADETTAPATRELISSSPLKGEYQLQNLSVALTIIAVLKSQNHYSLNDKLTNEAIKTGIEHTVWPGRLQSIQDPSTNISALLDGAHNESAAIELGKFLSKMRLDCDGFIFVIALTKGKSIPNLLKHITVRSKDTLIPTIFTPPEEMPWVLSYKTSAISKAADEFVEDVRFTDDESIEGVFKLLAELRKTGDFRPIVICGSLYLCSDVLRFINHEN